MQLRIFVHSVADDTNLGYLKEGRRFLSDVSAGGYQFDSFDRRDYLLAIYLEKCATGGGTSVAGPEAVQRLHARLP